MLLIIGYFIVLGSVVAGFTLAGGKLILLLHISEFVVIGGISLGVMIIASSKDVLIAIVKDIMRCLKGGGPTKQSFTNVLSLLYEIFMLSRKDGIIALDEHISEPQKSPIFSKYPDVLNNTTAMNFILNAYRPLIDGRVKPEQMDTLLEAELSTIEDESGQSVSVLNLIGDSLPGIGIVAAVLGIINTMNTISQGPEMVGGKVAAALTGTFLGVLGAYGFVNPLANRIKNNHRSQQMFLEVISTSILKSVNGIPPLMAIEYARRKIDPCIQPDVNELEALLKQLNKK